METTAYVLEEVELPSDSEDSFHYESLPVPSDPEDDETTLPHGAEAALPPLPPSQKNRKKKEDIKEKEEREKQEKEEEEEEEDLDRALKALEETRRRMAEKAAPIPPPSAALSRRPEVMDDFVRNFLIRLGMTRALEAFQSEWYEKLQRGELNKAVAGAVPDVYAQNQSLMEHVADLQRELKTALEVAARAKQTWSKFRKERDFHMLHHKRVAHEKSQLITDMQRLKKHYASFQPLIEETKLKYEKAMKEKMLIKLRMEQMEAQIAQLNLTIKQLEGSRLPDEQREIHDKMNAGVGAPAGKRSLSNPKTRDGGAGNGSTIGGGGTLTGTKQSSGGGSKGSTAGGGSLKKTATLMSTRSRTNPHAGKVYPPVVADRLNLAKTFRVHDMPVSCVALHPSRSIAATVSDDTTWKLWSIPEGELIMSGEGHRDWVSHCAFHSRGSHLATASGDGTVKVWEFATAKCKVTFPDHAQAVWGVTFIEGEDLLVSASMDHTARLWDLVAERCRQTFRGHVDSVNKVVTQPYSNYIATASGDKTVSLWDIRNGLCAQTFYGHTNAVNSVAVNLLGDTVVSADADGVVKLWDTRMISEKFSIDAGPQPVNDVAFDNSGEVVAICSDSGAVRLFDRKESRFVANLLGHEDACQSAVFDLSSKFLLTAGSDGTLRYWM